MTHSSTQNTPTQGHETNPTVRAPTRVVPRSVRLLGFWSGVGLAITYSVFDLGLIAGPSMLGILRQPWDPIIPIGASLLIVPSFLLLMISVHYAAPQPAKIWSHAAISFATVYASLVSLVYVTWLFVVEPHLLFSGTDSQVELLVFKPGSFMQMVDGIGYTFMGVAALFAAPCFIGPGLARWARFLSIVSGPAALLVFLAYVFYSFTLGLPAALLFPAYGVVLALYFRTLTVGAGLDDVPKERRRPLAGEAPPSRSLSRPPPVASPLVSAIAMIATALTPDPAPVSSRAGGHLIAYEVRAVRGQR